MNGNSSSGVDGKIMKDLSDVILKHCYILHSTDSSRRGETKINIQKENTL